MENNKIELIPLGKYVKVIGGYAFKSEDFGNEGIPIIRISDFNNNTVSLENASLIPEDKINKGLNYKIFSGDILIAMSGATTGKIGIVPNNLDRTILQNQRVGKFNILETNKINREYLKFILLSKDYQKNITSLMAGAAQPNISSSQLESIQIPLPPLPEQKRIAEILDKADELRAKRKEALAQLDSLVQSTFLEMFGDPVTNPKGWEIVKFERIGSSRLGKMLDSAKQSGKTKYPYLANFNILWGKIDISNIRYMEFNENELSEFSLQYDDILICEGGEVGRTAIWKFKDSNIYFQKALHRVRLFKEIVVPEYGLYFMLFMAKNNGFKDHVTIATIAHLTGIKLKKLPIPLPPLPLQQKFATIVESVERQKESMRAQLQEMDILFASLQDRAFKGEL